MNTSVRDPKSIDFYAEVDVCTTQEKMREYKKSYKNYPDAIEELMDCRGDILSIQETNTSSNTLTYFVLGLFLGAVSAHLAK